MRVPILSPKRILFSSFVVNQFPLDIGYLELHVKCLNLLILQSEQSAPDCSRQIGGLNVKGHDGLIALCLVLPWMLAGCGGGSGSGGTAPPPPLPTNQVQVAEGIYRGEAQSSLLVLRGVPYAQPPLGSLRFRPPSPVSSFTGVRDAMSAGPICAQDNQGSFAGSEDCLTLNIWTPDKSGSLPIIVFVHGGGFTEGASILPGYEGTNLAETNNVVVVTLNYRLGVTGFLALAALNDESSDNVSGNYGLLDVIEALRWIKSNGPAFGGDSERMFVLGHSAGGVAVCMLLASPLADDLMSAAGVMGAPCGLAMRLNDAGPTLPSAISVGDDLVARVGCSGSADVPQCLRDADIADLVAAETLMPRVQPFGLGAPPMLPNVDGVYFTDEPIAAVAAGTHGDLPLLIGANGDEVSVFLALALIANDNIYRLALTGLFGNLADAVYDIYPTAAFPNAKEAYIQLIGDLNVACPAEALANAAAPGMPSFLYAFDDEWPSGLSSLFGAFHGIELSYLFNSFDAYGISPTAQDQALSERLQEGWAGMADGSPADSSWSGYSRGAPIYMRYADQATVVNEPYRAGRCDGLRALGLTPG